MILMIFSTVRAPPRPGLHGRVVGHQADPSPLEAGQPGDEPIGRQRVGQRVGEHPVLDERAFIDQPGDPLADEQLALGSIGLVIPRGATGEQRLTAFRPSAGGTVRHAGGRRRFRIATHRTGDPRRPGGVGRPGGVRRPGDQGCCAGRPSPRPEPCCAPEAGGVTWIGPVGGPDGFW